MTVVVPSSTGDRQWYIVGRWQEYEGEGRANVWRMIAIGAFYLVQLVHYYGFTPANQRDEQFQQAATALAVIGTLVGLGVLLCLKRRIFPGLLKFVSTGCDVGLVTGLAAVGGGPHSPLTNVYFLIVALAGLRFSLRLVWFATLASLVAYLGLVGMRDATWFDAEHVVAPVEQGMMLVSLGLTGLVVGQMIRRVRALAVDYSRRMSSAGAE